MRGSYVLSAKFIKSGTGPCIKYKSALRLQRYVYISDDFCNNHGGKYTLIRYVPMSMPNCLFELVTWAGFRRFHCDKKKVAIALVTSRDKTNSPDVSGGARAMTGPDFVKHILLVDHTMSRYGAGERVLAF